MLSRTKLNQTKWICSHQLINQTKCIQFGLLNDRHYTLPPPWQNLYGKPCRLKLSSCKRRRQYPKLVLVSQYSKLNAFSLVYQLMTANPFSLVQFNLVKHKLNGIRFGLLINGQFFIQFDLVQFGFYQTKCIQF